MSRSYDPRPREPAKWFARFQAYLRLGSARSIEAAYRASRPEGSPTVAAPGSWHRKAAEWSWLARAADYDRDEAEHQRAKDRREREGVLKRHREQAKGVNQRAVRGVANAITDGLPLPAAVATWANSVRVEGELWGLDEPEPTAAVENANTVNVVNNVSLHGVEIDREVLEEFVRRKAQRDAARQDAPAHVKPATTEEPPDA